MLHLKPISFVMHLNKKTKSREHVLVTVIVKLIVAAQSRQTPLTNPKREENLCTCIHPNLRCQNINISEISLYLLYEWILFLGLWWEEIELAACLGICVKSFTLILT